MWQFFALHFWLIFASFGMLGFVVGAVLFVVLGWSFAAVLAAALNLAKAIIQFFETPIGEVVGVLILCAIAWFAADIRRTRIDAAAQEIAVQHALAQAADTAERNRVERDAAIQREIKAAADREIEGIEAEKTQLEGKVKSYEAALAKRPACVVTPDDLAAGRLRRKP